MRVTVQKVFCDLCGQELGEGDLERFRKKKWQVCGECDRKLRATCDQLLSPGGGADGARRALRLLLEQVGREL